MNHAPYRDPMVRKHTSQPLKVLDRTKCTMRASAIVCTMVLNRKKCRRPSLSLEDDGGGGRNHKPKHKALHSSGVRFRSGVRFLKTENDTS
jgi:hypothetical protein